jgi:hypothetical protein
MSVKTLKPEPNSANSFLSQAVAKIGLDLRHASLGIAASSAMTGTLSAYLVAATEVAAVAQV